MENTQILALSELLKTGTRELHEQLDQHVIGYQPFSDQQHYQAFLRMQLRLHSAVEPLYQSDYFEQLLPGLKLRSRLTAVLQDCQDMAVPAELKAQDQQFARSARVDDLYAGLGWLYTVEGSTLGAAMLLKHVKQTLNLSETFGARHMAAHADGRATHWREFKALLDALDLSDIQRQQALEGAKQAFIFTLETVEAVMTPPEAKVV